MKKIIIIVGLLFSGYSFADVALSPGQSISMRGQIITCNSGLQQQKTHCFCADSGCSTGYTSAGNVILNVVTTDNEGYSRTKCATYNSELTCIQAMAACN